MNNVICILIDSLSWQAIGTNIADVSPTPFLDSLCNESIITNNLYAQGPYTDAATKALYTGEDTLDNFGYYFRLNNANNNHFSVFHNNGYHTYGFYYPFYMYGNNIKKDIDSIFYTSMFEFESEWNGLYYYYVDIIKKRDLLDEEYLILKKRLELMFEVWIGFYEDILLYPRTSLLIKEEIEGVPIKESLLLLRTEYEKFVNDYKTYIKYFLTQETRKFFNNIEKIDVDKKIKYSYINKEIYKKYSSVFKKAKINNFNANMINNHISFKQMLFLLKKFRITKDNDYLKPFYQFSTSLFSIKTTMKNYMVHKWQYVPSCGKQLRFALDVLKNHDIKIPFYASLHLEDMHGYINFFSPDNDDNDISVEECEVLSKYISSLGTKFKGNLAYLLSLRYIDFCIEKFVGGLKEAGIWDNTTMVIIADHGNSNIGYPIHDKGKQTNCFFDENYHIPLIIRTPMRMHKIIDEYCTSKDVLPTVMDLVGIKTPSSMIGKSLIQTNRIFDKFIITEYMGPGCPDMFSREIWFSIRDNHFLVSYLVPVAGSFSDGHIEEVYDLTEDKLCQFNKKGIIGYEEFAYLLCALEKRFEKIHNETEKYKKDLLEF